MAREKIEIKRIANASGRQVTFSKRRRGLFKKARELSTLCEADVALLAFSSTGKLYDYSSSSMKTMLEKYILLSATFQKDGHPNLECESGDLERIKQQSEDISQSLRKMQGEELEGLSLKDLELLEEQLEMGLSRIRSQKGEHFIKKINELQQRGIQMIEENTKLRQQLKEGHGCHVDSQSSESITTDALNFKLYKSPMKDDEDFDASLQLGYEAGV